MVNLKTFFPLAVVSSLALFTISADTPQQTRNPVVAEVGPKKFYYLDVIERKKTIPQVASAPLESVYQGLLQQMVAEHLIKEEVSKSASEIEKSSEFKDLVKKCQESAKTQLFIQQRIEKLVTDEKLLELFNKVKKEFKEQDEVFAQHILVETESTANMILADLKNGKNFDELAREKSTDSSTKERGGKLGYFTKEIAKTTLGPEFAEAAFLLKSGNQRKVKSKFGWHVIRVTDKRKSKPPKFEQVVPQLRALQSQQSLLKYIEELMKSKGVKLYDTTGKEIQWDRQEKKAMEKEPSGH